MKQYYQLSLFDNIGDDKGDTKGRFSPPPTLKNSAGGRPPSPAGDEALNTPVIGQEIADFWEEVIEDQYEKASTEAFKMPLHVQLFAQAYEVRKSTNSLIY